MEWWSGGESGGESGVEVRVEWWSGGESGVEVAQVKVVHCGW